jgi:predicted RNA binding protein YcfA (HicA-like mRNA interferase family)
MPKLPAVKPRDLIRFLEQNGFEIDHVTGSHHIYRN